MEILLLSPHFLQLEKKTNEANSLSRRMHEIEEMNKSIGNLQDKISRLVNENTSLEDEMRNAQENLRLSSAQQAKLNRELNEYKQKIEDNNR